MQLHGSRSAVQDLIKVFGNNIRAPGSSGIFDEYLGRNLKQYNLANVFGTAPDGQYRILVRTVTLNGNPTMASGWNAYRSAPFAINRGD